MVEGNQVKKQNIGNSGEYYLASRLSAEDFIVTITLGRAEKYDLLAVAPKGKTIKISVKARFHSDVQRFPLSKKDEEGGSEDFYYAFIRLNDFKREPDFWIIPSKRVNELLTKSSHVYFKERSRRDGKEHVDVGLRNLWIQINKTSRGLFPDNWEEELTRYYKNIKQLKSKAIEKVILEYGTEVLEPELKPEFIEKMKKRQFEPSVKIDNFKKHFGIN